MDQEILRLALAVTGAGEAGRAVLEVLCPAAEDAWRRRLRAGPEECWEAFLCAAAFTAAADYLAGGGGPASFTAGAVSVTAPSGAERAAQAANLRAAAERLMAPYAAVEDFCFLGVAP